MKLVFASDLAPIRHFASIMEFEHPLRIYGDLLPRLQSGDYRIVNLESPLAGSRFIAKSGAAFTGTPASIGALTGVPFEAVERANNHTFDCGLEGYEETSRILAENKIASTGAGKNLEEAREPLIAERKGVRFALFSLSEGEDQMGAGEDTPGVRPWEPETLATEIRARKSEFDFVIVSAYCGLEYQPWPSFYVWKTFQLLAEAGADLIIGHHPHVPQGMAFFGQVPAFFSLGNFCFYQKTDLFYRKIGYFLEVTLEKGKSPEVEKVPYKITDEGLRLMIETEKHEFDLLFAELSRPLASEEGALAAWHAVLAHNGAEGHLQELEKILDTFRNDQVKGAAMLRNRVTCIQHRSQWIDGLTRIMDGTIGCAEPDLVKMVEAYKTRKVTP